MNTTALRNHAGYHRHPLDVIATMKAAVRSAAGDFVASLLAITKAGLLSQQTNRPRLRRF